MRTRVAHAPRFVNTSETRRTALSVNPQFTTYKLKNSVQTTGATAPATVGKWRKRFVEQRISGLHDKLRPGAPRSIDDERVAMLINTTLKTKPADGSTHWSTRTLAEHTGISKSAVQRFLSLFAVQPHRAESFKLSTDTLF